MLSNDCARVHLNANGHLNGYSRTDEKVRTPNGRGGRGRGAETTGKVTYLTQDFLFYMRACLYRHKDNLSRTGHSDDVRLLLAAPRT